MDAIQNQNNEASFNQNNVTQVTKPLARRKLIDNFAVLGLGSLIYGIIFTFCMYKNLHGITSTILVYATFGYAYFLLKKLEYTFSKKHILYGVIGALLGFNLMYTMDYWVLFVDYVAIILVFVTGIFSVICDTKDWDFADSISQVLEHVVVSIGDTFDILTDLGVYNKEVKKKNTVAKYIVIGIAVSIPLVSIVIALLSSADIVFGDMLGNIFEDVDFGTIVGIIFMYVGVTLGSYAWMGHFSATKGKFTHKDKRVGEPAILITIGIILGVVYLAFCVVQIVYLFAGVGELPSGYTYAEYAREGFFQLLFVCLINLVFILVGVHNFKESKALKIVLTVITACTYIMIASSAYRMYLYVSEYQMSILRLWVLWTLVWLTFILIGALINVYYNKFSLFLFSMIVTSVLYLSLAYARPAYLVAKYNLSDRFETGEIDYGYINYDLNPDAASVVYEYYSNNNDDAKEDCLSYFGDGSYRAENKVNLRNFNISGYNYYNIKLR